MSNVELHRVREADKAVLANLMQLYRYDLSEFRGYELTPHGTFIYRFLDQYFVEPERQAWFITDNDNLAGFVLVRRLSENVRSLAEFFIARRHRRSGVGRTAATLVMRQDPGTWQLSVDHANYPAVEFWTDVIEQLADGSISVVEKGPREATFPSRWFTFDVPPDELPNHPEMAQPSS